MFEGLSKKGSSVAIRRSIGGLIGVGVLWVMVFLNIPKLPPETLVRWKWGVCVIGVLVVAASIVNWVRAARSSPLKGIEEFCASADSPEAMMERLDKTWREGVQAKMVRMDEEYVICLIGIQTRVIALRDVIWTYKYVSRTNGVEYARFELVTRDGKRQSYKLNHDVGVIDAVVRHIAASVPDVVTGYSDEMEKLYRKKDFEGLRACARQRV